MKINTNIIGNYNPYNVNGIKKVAQPKQAVTIKSTSNITKEEKSFFMNMYPENKSEIVDYHFYQRSGKMNGVSLGTLFDRRG